MLTLALLCTLAQEPIPLPPQPIHADARITTDLAPIQAGQVAVKIRADYTRTTYAEATLDCQLDGVTRDVQVGSVIRRRVFLSGGTGLDLVVPIDTTTLADGEHALRLLTYVKPLGAGARNAIHRSEISRFCTYNGKALRGPRANFATIYLEIGESVSISPRAVACNGDEVEVPALYTFDNTGICTVNTAGQVKALANGEANVYSWLGSRYATTRVVVTPHAPIPTLAPKFVAAVFGLSGDECDKTPGLADAAKLAGINTLTSGFFSNQADGSGTDAQSITNNRRLVDRVLAQSTKYDMGLLGVGDDIARSARERLWSSTSPTAAAILRETTTRLRESGQCVAIDMVDEANYVMPSGPTSQVMAILEAMGSDRPSQAWPNAGGTNSTALAAWCSISGHTSEYPHVTAYPVDDNGPTLASYLESYRAKELQYRSHVRPGMPRLALTYIDGVTYIKVNADGEYTPGVDKVRTAGIGPDRIVASIFLAAMQGYCGVRIYGLDTGLRKRSRINAAIGAGVSTGADPFAIGLDRWAAMSHALNLIHTLEPQLFGQPYHAPDLGDGIATAARAGANGRLLMIASFRESAEPVRVDLAPYRMGGKVVRYTLAAAGVTGPVEVAGSEDRVTLAPGQCAAWVAMTP